MKTKFYILLAFVLILATAVVFAAGKTSISKACVTSCAASVKCTSADQEVNLFPSIVFF